MILLAAKTTTRCRVVKSITAEENEGKGVFWFFLVAGWIAAGGGGGEGVVSTPRCCPRPRSLRLRQEKTFRLKRGMSDTEYERAAGGQVPEA
jgi:hypothetical protein